MPSSGLLRLDPPAKAGSPGEPSRKASRRASPPRPQRRSAENLLWRDCGPAMTTHSGCRGSVLRRDRLQRVLSGKSRLFHHFASPTLRGHRTGLTFGQNNFENIIIRRVSRTGSGWCILADRCSRSRPTHADSPSWCSRGGGGAGHDHVQFGDVQTQLTAASLIAPSV